ncbi:partial Fuc2NAc and GlcNAc transferase, partial [Methylococcales bacterium]
MLLHFAVVLLVSILLTGAIRSYALTRKVLDIPNQRSSHTVPTPRGGGLAIVLAFMAALLMLFFTSRIEVIELAALSSGLLVAGIGFCDDHGHVAARWRFLTHVLAALMALIFLQGLPLLLLPTPIDGFLNRRIVDLAWLGYPLGVLFLVWLLNLFNFMDGTDGIAASESLFVSLALAGYLF